MTRTTSPASLARQAAETAYRANPNPATLAALRAAGQAEMDEYLAGFDARRAAEAAAEVEAAPEGDPWKAPAAPPSREDYTRYVADGLGATDGHFAPLDFEHWAATLGRVLA
ncbi:hypothetical protein ACH5AL_24515 [Actinacidiphila glaucinigra]|uniref:hypothetical protein n=1 Tax=Actinacidiphila glaucinigra TaxID=235986 RepID=UPI0037983004